MGRFHDSLIRCFRFVMLFDSFRTDTFFCNEFYGRAEEVVEKSPFIAVEVIKKGDDLWII